LRGDHYRFSNVIPPPALVKLARQLPLTIAFAVASGYGTL
jgi:hypothetical protein